MVTVVLKVYRGIKPLYDKNGKIENETQLIKLSEFVFMNKFIPLMMTMGYCQVDLVDAYESSKIGTKTSIDPEKIAEFEQALSDKLNIVVPKIKKKEQEPDLEKEEMKQMIAELQAKFAAIESTNPTPKPRPKKSTLPNSNKNETK